MRVNHVLNTIWDAIVTVYDQSFLDADDINMTVFTEVY